MDYIKKIFKNFWLLSIFCVVMGLGLIIDPGFFSKTVCRVIGGLFTAYGAVDLILYFSKKDGYATGLVKGILMCAAGIFILIRPDFIPKVIAIICGLYMTISGIVNLQDSLNLKRFGVASWKTSFIPAVITTVVGVILIVDPMLSVDFALIILGIALLVSGLTNIFGWVTASRKIKKYNKIVKRKKLEKYTKNDGGEDYIDI